ncbi:MAG: nicotinamide-nucleotide adenylyltransferase [Halobacteriaceae archaeon]
MTRGFYVGRFQPFHRGHQHVVEQIAEEVDELVVAVGSAGESHTTKDPFTGGERVMMLTRTLVDLDLVTYVVPIEDIERHAVWVSHLRSMCPEFDVVFSNNPLVIRLFEEDGTPVRRVPMHNREVLEGTEIRERMVRGSDWEPLVPDAVAEVVSEIDGVGRIQRISESDANGE